MPGHWTWFTLPLIHFPGMHRLLVGREYIRALSPWNRYGRAAWALGQEMLCRPQTVVAVAAHPDDLEYFCGGTLALLARRGVRVVAVLATRGERGGRQPDLPVRREREQQVAAQHLGYAAVHIYAFPDGGVRADDPALRARLRGVLEAEQPDLLLTFDPDRPFPLYHHPDHFAVARAALSLWDGLALLFHTRSPNAVMDITATFRDKLAAFVCHRTQLPRRGTNRLAGWHLISRSVGRDARFRRRLVELFRVSGAEAGALPAAPMPAAVGETEWAARGRLLLRLARLNMSGRFSLLRFGRKGR